MKIFLFVTITLSILQTLAWGAFILDLPRHFKRITDNFRGDTTNNFYIKSHNTQVNTYDDAKVEIKELS
jgi:hypothetical protein